MNYMSGSAPNAKRTAAIHQELSEILVLAVADDEQRHLVAVGRVWERPPSYGPCSGLLDRGSQGLIRARARRAGGTVTKVNIELSCK